MTATDADAALADQSDQLSRECNVPSTAPTEGLTKIPSDGWCFYKAILAAEDAGDPNKPQIYIVGKHINGQASQGAYLLAKEIANTIRADNQELNNFKHLFGESIKTNVLDENENVTENVTLTPEQYLAEMIKPLTNPNKFPRVYGEGVALLQAAAQVTKKKIAIYDENGNLLAVGCPTEETNDVISLKFVSGNHYDVFLPDEVDVAVAASNKAKVEGRSITPKIYELLPNKTGWKHNKTYSAVGSRNEEYDEYIFSSGGRRKSPRRRRKLRKSTFRRHRKH